MFKRILNTTKSKRLEVKHYVSLILCFKVAAMSPKHVLNTVNTSDLNIMNMVCVYTVVNILSHTPLCISMISGVCVQGM